MASRCAEGAARRSCGSPSREGLARARGRQITRSSGTGHQPGPGGEGTGRPGEARRIARFMSATRPGELPDELAQRLLATATGFSGLQRLPELVQRLRPAFALAPEPLLAGIALQDDERGRLVLHLVRPENAALEVVELRAAEARAHRAAPGEGLAFARAGRNDPSDALTSALAQRGVQAWSGAVLVFGERFLGTLVLGERSASASEPARLAYLERLARIVEAHVWGCLTDERFARGDRRRD